MNRIQNIAEMCGIVLLMIIIIPLIILVSPFLFFDISGHDKEYEEFLKLHNGKVFFCYTSRIKSRLVIEDGILPFLSKDINIIFLNGKNPVSEFPQRYISRMLYEIKNIGFPNLMEIKNGKVSDISLKQRFYSKYYKLENAEEFLKEINFELAKLRN